jgi:AmmeMemoRadiSam system protein B
MTMTKNTARRRPAAVAGTFYPGTAQELGPMVDSLMVGARRTTPGGPVPKALIVPHAGYVYSGPVAASAYARLAPARGRVSRVVLLGPAHRVAFTGLALPEADALETPLGALRAGGADAPGIVADWRPHAEEHSLEVQLPFLQRVLGDVEVIPLLVGNASPEDVGRVIDALWGGDETVIIVSSDLSHYHAYEAAREIDAGTAAQIQALGPMLRHDQACGATPVDGLMVAAKRRGLRVEVLDLRNSGDTAGPRDRVVGYGAFAFYESGKAGAQ